MKYDEIRKRNIANIIIYECWVHPGQQKNNKKNITIIYIFPGSIVSLKHPVLCLIVHVPPNDIIFEVFFFSISL